MGISIGALPLSQLVFARDRRNRYLRKVLATVPIAYWPLDELTGTQAVDASGNARHGTHTGVDLGLPGIGDGRTSPFYDGVNDYTNIYSVSLRDAFNGAEGTVMVWARVANAGVWAEAGPTVSRLIWRLFVDASNLIIIEKGTGADTIVLRYRAGATTKEILHTTTDTGWLFFSQTWNRAAGVDGEFKAFVNGTQSGVTQTGLGVWAGALDPTRTLLGAASTVPTNVWHGNLAHAALWSRALSPAEVASLAQVN